MSKKAGRKEVRMTLDGFLTVLALVAAIYAVLLPVALTARKIAWTFGGGGIDQNLRGLSGGFPRPARNRAVGAPFATTLTCAI